MLKHVYAGLGTVSLRDLHTPKVRQFVRELEAKPRMSGATVGQTRPPVDAAIDLLRKAE